MSTLIYITERPIMLFTTINTSIIMKQILFISLAFILCISCSHIANDKGIEEKLLSVTITDEPVKIKDLYEYARFIPLENGENCMLSRVVKAAVKDTLVYMLDKDPYPSIKVFSTNGRHIRNIGRLGHGKGEYEDIDDFTTNPKGDSLFILCNNRILAYNNKGEFLFQKIIDKKGQIRRIESCNGGYVCLIEHKGDDNLLHFLDYDFEKKRDLISSGGKIIKVPSSVHNPIQVKGKDVWYCHYFTSTLYVVDTQDDYKTTSYRINTDKANKIERFENYVFTNDYDAVTFYSVDGDQIFGFFNVAQEHDWPFIWNLNSEEIIVKHTEEWIPYVKAINSGLHYSIITQDYFIRLSEQFAKQDNLNSNYLEVSNSVTEKDNFVLVELKPKNND